jgi:hypothetical protein
LKSKLRFCILAGPLWDLTVTDHYKFIRLF